jgi:hypothetical protein
VIGLISDNDETAYREAVWCQDNNLSLNVSKTKELIVDYRKRRAERAPIQNRVVERVESFKFLGVHITNKLWSKHTDSREEGTTTPFPPQETEKILKKFYSCTIESMTGCITAWYGNCSALDCKALQRVVRMAQYITGANLPAIQDLYNRLCQREAQTFVRNSSHTSHRLISRQAVPEHRV